MQTKDNLCYAPKCKPTYTHTLPTNIYTHTYTHVSTHGHPPSTVYIDAIKVTCHVAHRTASENRKKQDFHSSITYNNNMYLNVYEEQLGLRTKRYILGFLNCSTLLFGAGEFFVVGDCLGPCRMFSSNLGLYSLDVSSTPFPLAVSIKNVSRHCQCPLAGEGG